MPSAVATTVTRVSRRALCATVAVTLGLMCAVLAVGALAAPMTDMPEMTATSMSASPLTTVGEATPAAGAPVLSSTSPVIAMVCADTCVDEISTVCGGVAALTILTLLALLLGSRRHTFLGLLARRHRSAPARPGSDEPSPWIPLSPVSLCVLRV